MAAVGRSEIPRQTIRGGGGKGRDGGGGGASLDYIDCN